MSWKTRKKVYQVLALEADINNLICALEIKIHYHLPYISKKETGAQEINKSGPLILDLEIIWGKINSGNRTGRGKEM